MLGKLVLWANALGLMGYGLLSFIVPSIPVGYIGFVIANADSHLEMVAMYGGLETGLGLFCLLGALRREYFKASLILVVLTMGGLALGRIYSFVLSDDPGNVYTYGAMLYESAMTVLASIAALQAHRRPE